MSACGFTGYRFEKLPFSRKDAPAIELLKAKLKKAVLCAFEKGCEDFICGFAEGSDLIFAQAVTELKAEHEGLRLEAALPFESPHVSWCDSDKMSFESLIARCDSVKTLSKTHTRGCYFARNDYIIENSERMIAVYDGKPGGTAYTVERAKRRGLPIDIIDP